VNALASLQVDALLSYAVAIVLPALDAILPLLPSETAVITLGVATAVPAAPLRHRDRDRGRDLGVLLVLHRPTGR
jgi:hypothetical protein